MTHLTIETIQKYRHRTYRLRTGQRLSNIQEAVAFVKERGFVYFWPIKGIEYPSLWTAVAGNRPVADAHDDPGHITWGWKDGALGKKIWYYAKILRKRATMIDLEIAPYFYALSENYGDPPEDVRIAYHEGRLTLESKSIFDAILENGPLDTISIRRKTRMTSKESNSRFDRALSTLQADFKILPVGISDAGGWRYAFIYDLVHRHYPELQQAARHIQERTARCKLIELYFRSVGAGQLRDVTKLFGWQKKDAVNAIDSLIRDGIIQKNVNLSDCKNDHLVLTKLITNTET